MELKNKLDAMFANNYPPSYEDYYRAAIYKMGGPEQFKSILPASLHELRKAYQKDPNFNTISLSDWDKAAGYQTHNSQPPRYTHITTNPLQQRISETFHTTVSLGTAVGLLKTAAEMLVQQTIPVYHRYGIAKSPDDKEPQYVQPHYWHYTTGLVCTPDESIYNITLMECAEGRHDMVAWQETDSTDIDFIFKNKMLLTTCFPYGVDAEIKRDRGRIVYLKIIDQTYLCKAKDLKEHRRPWDIGAETLWKQLGDIPMNPETECMEEAFLHFAPGTHRETIWHWFEDYFDLSVARDLMHI